jgi:hypothetical protein
MIRQADAARRHERADGGGLELLYAKIEALEGKRPLAHRRSRR